MILEICVFFCLICNCCASCLAGNVTDLSEILPKEKRVLDESLTICCNEMLQNEFSRVLLVIQFSMRTIYEPLIERTYSCHFLHIFLCGLSAPSNHPDYKYLSNSSYTTLNVVTTGPSSEPSRFQFACMVEAMKHSVTSPKYNGTKYHGFMFMQDDVLVNYWNFRSRHDFHNVWRAYRFADPDFVDTHQHINIYDLDSVPRIARQHIGPYRQAIINYLSIFTPIELDRLFRANSAGCSIAQYNVSTLSGCIRMANSDFYYLPRWLKHRFMEVMVNAEKFGVFHEIAVPAFFDAVVEPENQEPTIGAALYRVSNSFSKIGLYDPCFDYFHKMKISIRQERQFFLDTIGQRVASYVEVGEGRCKNTTDLMSYVKCKDQNGNLIECK